MSSLEGLDWEAWRARLEGCLRFADGQDGPVRFRDLFAPGGLFQDPAHPPTDDIAGVEATTAGFCPDWSQTVTSFHHGADWAVFEWVGGGGFAGLADGSAKGAVMRQEGITKVIVDVDGQITHWRDYLCRKDVIDQVKAAVVASRGGSA